MDDSRWQAWGPVTTRAEATSLVAALRSAGVPTRSAAVVPLDHGDGIEPRPLARWVLGRAGRQALNTALVCLPFLVALFAGVFWLQLDEPTSLTLTVGLVGGFGAAPVAGLIGFALGWTRWSALAELDDALIDERGFLVIAANVPAIDERAARDIAPLFRAARPGRTHA